MAIRRLPPLLVNQIAAGEVIERPASVVKELIENSIDAGALRVSIAVEKGGKERICISDDGCGIAEDDLPLALAPHATSKIAEQHDLDAIATMGFRGEALASITSVSRLSIKSRPHDADHGCMIEAEGQSISEVRPTGSPVGTTIDVRNLFFNTPARRKFLKTDQTETTRVREVVQTLALSHPTIGFELMIDGRVSLELPPRVEPRARVLDVLGTELADELLELDVSDRGLRLWGMMGQPAIARGTAKHTHVYINGRRINDKSVNHAIREAYRGLIEPGRYPTIVLFIQMEPSQVDVNVHPAKAEVRFRQQGMVHGAILTALRTRLREADLTPELGLRDQTSTWDFQPTRSPEFGSGQSEKSDQPHPATSSFVEHFQRLNPAQKGFVYTEVKQALERDAPDVFQRISDSSGQSPPPSTGNEDPASPATSIMPMLRAASSVMQLNSTFLITHDEQGLLIIDQHALHERVMFEKLKNRITSSGQLESQRLLMPATVEVDDSQMEAFEQSRPLLARLGIEVEPVGPRSLAVHAFTTLLFERKVEPAAFLGDMLTRIVEEGINPDDEAALHEVLDMMSCKAAIKAGDSLTEQELADLLRFREEVERASNCPHGRPTSLRLTMRELERRFGRR